MKYPLNTANGDAGEFFAAYKIAKELGWPCRLFDIDIGIDAQVEILTGTRESTGRYVALQVKATSAEEVNCRYVNARQLQYWNSLEIPVFVVLVDLQQELMYLHMVKEKSEYEMTTGGRYKIPFDLANDLFSSASASALADASERIAMGHINSYLNPARNGIDRILRAVQQLRSSSPDPWELIECMESRTALSTLIDQAVAVSIMSHVGVHHISTCREELSWALRDLQKGMTPMRIDYADKGDIAGFLEEDYVARPDDD